MSASAETSRSRRHRPARELDHGLLVTEFSSICYPFSAGHPRVYYSARPIADWLKHRANCFEQGAAYERIINTRLVILVASAGAY